MLRKAKTSVLRQECRAKGLELLSSHRSFTAEQHKVKFSCNIVVIAEKKIWGAMWGQEWPYWAVFVVIGQMGGKHLTAQVSCVLRFILHRAIILFVSLFDLYYKERTFCPQTKDATKIQSSARSEMWDLPFYFTRFEIGFSVKLRCIPFNQQQMLANRWLDMIFFNCIIKSYSKPEEILIEH